MRGKPGAASVLKTHRIQPPDKRAAKQHSLHCQYTRWPIRPEIVSLLLLTLAWRATRLVQTLEMEPRTGDPLVLRKYRRVALAGLMRCLNLVDLGYSGMTANQYRDWLGTLGVEVRATRSEVSQKWESLTPDETREAWSPSLANLSGSARDLLAKILGLDPDSLPH